MFNVGELFLSDTWPDPGKCWTPLTRADFSESWGHSSDQPLGLVSEMGAKAAFCIQTGVSNTLQPENRAGSCSRDFKSLFVFISLKWPALKRRDDFHTGQTPLFCQLLPYSCFLPITVSVIYLLPLPIWRKKHISNSCPPSCLPSHIPFTSNWTGQAVCHHCLKLLQLFWNSSSWLSFLRSARTAWASKSCLFAKFQSWSFFSSSLTLPFFCAWIWYYSAQYIVLPVSSHCVFCLHCYSLLYHLFGVHSPSLSQLIVHSDLSYDPLFKQSTF